MRFYLASDHAGFELKRYLVRYLKESGIDAADLGPHDYQEHDDYPDWISLAAAEVSKDPANARGIVIGLSGQGEAIVANKFPNVRAAVYYGGHEEIVRLCREHNDANVLSLGAKFLNFDQAERAVDLFIETLASDDERHLRRIKKIKKYEHL